jgi:hypothetical protein
MHNDLVPRLRFTPPESFRSDEIGVDRYRRPDLMEERLAP